MGSPSSPDDDPAADWAKDERTVADGVPVPIEPTTPPVENTGRHRLTPAQFASGVELAERDGYARGLEHGRAKGRAEAEADVVTEARKIREDVIETVRQLFVIFELGFPDWETAERWIRSRLTPL